MKASILALILFSPIAAWAADPPSPQPAVCQAGSVCMPGDALSLVKTSQNSASGSNFKATLTSTQGVAVSIPAVPAQEGNPASSPARCSASVSGALCLVLPDDLVDGSYSIVVKGDYPPAKKDSTQESTSGASQTTQQPVDIYPTQIQVQRPSIRLVAPQGSFWEPDHSNKIVVLGKGFMRGAKETDAEKKRWSSLDELRFHNASTPRLCDAAKDNLPCYTLTVDSDQQVTLYFFGTQAPTGSFSGKYLFVLAVNGVETSESTLILITTSAQTPMTIAAIGLLVIVLAIYLLLHAGRTYTKQTMNGKTYWLGALFLDVPTNTYSLSKCQFYAWTAAAVFGYLFLAVSRSVVQGSGVFPDIPSGLPGILIASVGTVVVSTGITSAKGDKGAGNPGPNLSDFIASGGVIAPDRLQFAIWTIIGIATFLGIILQSDPRSINDLPAIPNGFLEMMGISSAGYLAGKLVRKPGPTLTSLAVRQVSGVPAGLRFELTGSGLSRSAVFTVDDEPIFPDPLVGDNNLKGPQILKQDPSNNDPDFASVLTFTVPNPPGKFLGKHDFAIVNPDAQKAMRPYQIFKVKEITISRRAAAAGAPDAVWNLKITGDCLDTNLKVQYGTGAAAADVTTPVMNGADYTATIPAAVAPGAVTITVTDQSGTVFVQVVTATETP
jgi:hypothetical protein